jgi:small GTP-binding protein
MGAQLGHVITTGRDTRVVMVGLDGAGKTTILYQLKLDEEVSTTPTIGFNVETIYYKNCRLTVWDVGGQDKLRTLWKHYFSDTVAVVFVVDSSDITRFDEAATELHNVLKDLEKNVALLVIANKQDLNHSRPPKEISTALRLGSLACTWHIQGACAKTGEGLSKGLDWLTSVVDCSSVVYVPWWRNFSFRAMRG